MNAHLDPEPQRSAEPLLGADLPSANAPCWKPALRFMERGVQSLCLAALLLAGAPGFSAVAPRLNVLFLFSDDQRFDTVHALGNSEIRTPNLDRLVRRGTAFTHAYIMGGGQGAVCMPSRAMLLTGRTLFRATTTYTGNIIPPEVPTWPQVFREAGYDAFAIGKWHNDRPSFARSFNGGGPRPGRCGPRFSPPTATCSEWSATSAGS